MCGFKCPATKWDPWAVSRNCTQHQRTRMFKMHSKNQCLRQKWALNSLSLILAAIHLILISNILATPKLARTQTCFYFYVNHRQILPKFPKQISISKLTIAKFQIALLTIALLTRIYLFAYCLLYSVRNSKFVSLKIFTVCIKLIIS